MKFLSFFFSGNDVFGSFDFGPSLPPISAPTWLPLCNYGRFDAPAPGNVSMHVTVQSLFVVDPVTKMQEGEKG